ncbi:glycosyltransferase (plasmid) [Tistrella mobilis]|uniref:Spore protein YkvP/CgeB glycosyl transferase-like domain-containing protein n=1 Tax=Tistrella mobilis TaxID=171437 RepID=A0A162LJS2_9PROT|nr:glycosyltransferase [Tistrella mobilis]KYO55300.1 hypothetical protein AUP44_23680 [Tistrella mobilis]
MKIAFYGSSILSSYWNGAATYYRGIVRALSGLGHEVTFLEPDAFGRQERRDIDPPAWCRVVVWQPDAQGLEMAVAHAAKADVVIKSSGVGVHDDELLDRVMTAARPDALRLFWDVDAPATLHAMATGGERVLAAALPGLDAVLTYGGGPGVVADYTGAGARACLPVYNAVDLDTHHPVAPDPRFAADLAFLGNRLPDRETRVRRFFLEPAAAAPGCRMILGGAGWVQDELPQNVRAIGHVGTADHNAFNVTPRMVLNVNRDSMAERGFSPPTRIFEAAAAGACLITDHWPGIETFFEPGREILVAGDGRDVLAWLGQVMPERAAEIGARARARIVQDHTYDRRGREVDQILRRLSDRKARERAA